MALLIRDRVCGSVLNVELQDLYKGIGPSLEGLIDELEMRVGSGEYALRARHRIIAEIVWKKCGSHELREHTFTKSNREAQFYFQDR